MNATEAMQLAARLDELGFIAYRIERLASAVEDPPVHIACRRMIDVVELLLNHCGRTTSLSVH